MLHPLLENIRREEPGRYLTQKEMSSILYEQDFMSARLEAARNAERLEQAILDDVIPTVLRKYDFRGRFEYGESKCYRDVGAVYRYCVFAMLCGDEEMLKNKLLYWMRTIVQSLNFPSGNESIKYTYALLRSCSQKRMRPEDYQMMEPYLKAVEEILPS